MMKRYLLTIFLAGVMAGGYAQQSHENPDADITFVETSAKLHGNVPNPVKEFTRIKFQLNTSGPVSIKLYDMLGNPVVDLLEEDLSAGTYSIPVDTTNFPEGIYFYVLKKDDTSQIMRMVISK